MKSSFYKYCPIYDETELDSEYSLINLINNQVTFSKRTNFNDLFDSKVNFIKPTNKELKALIPRLKGKEKAHFKNIFLNNNNEFLHIFLDKLEKRFDEYLFYCVTDNPESNLMWSHYANSHKGFCIEWDSATIKAEKVNYQEEIPSFHLIDLIKSYYLISSNEESAIKIWKALRTKLSEWDYESEYRLQLKDKKYSHVIDNKKDFSLVEYEPEWLKSIIFGCRMSVKARQYIIERMPLDTKYKEIVVGKSSIKVVNVN